MWSSLVLVLLFSGQGFSQCFTSAGCTGDQVPADNRRECCIETDTGLSYNDGGTCTVCIVHGFSRAVYTVSEGELLNTRFELNVKGTTNFPGFLNIQGTITSMAGGDATPGSDFSNIRPMTFANEANMRLFAINDDTTLEYNEYVTLTFTPGNPAVITGLEGEGEYVRTSAIVNIIDNDRLEINFEESDYAIGEGSSLSTPIRLQFRINQNAFNITFSPVTIDTVEGMGLGANFINSETIEEEARAEPADFTHASLTIEIPAATTVFEVPDFFNVIDDDIDEVEQSFAIVAELGPDVTEVPFNFSCFQLQPGERECFGRRGVTEIRITDNDLMVIGFTTRSQTVSEGDAPPGNDFNYLRIDVATERTSERLYTIVFRHLESASTAIVQSNVIQRDPLFDALFGNEDNDPLEERFVLPTGSDVIPSLVTSVRNDFRPEDDECYTIAIFTTDVSGAHELFDCNDDNDMADNFFCLHTICIINDDAPFVVAFVQTMYTVVESEGPVEVCVNLTRPGFDILDETVRVRVTNDEGSIYIPAGVRLATPDTPDFLSMYPMEEGTDYAEQTFYVNAINDQGINATRRIVCYDQSIYDDERLEVSEYAGLTLDVAEREEYTTVRTEVQDLYDFASIQILDDDRARVGLEMTFYSLSEGVGVVELCAVVYEPNITCPIEFPFNISLSTADGIAVDPTDYGELDMILQFDTCDVRQCTFVSIVNDLVDEPEEFFIYTLERTPGLDGRIDLDPTIGTVVITDDAILIEVGYEFTQYATSEGQGAVDLSITIFTPPTGGAPRPFSLSVSTEDNTAMAPGDYGAVTNEIITFTEGQMRATHTIIINQDDDCENDPNENFFSNISLNSGQQPISVIQPRAEVIIDDTNEPECQAIVVGYEFTSYTTSEGIGFADLCAVVMSHPGGAPRPFTIAATSEDGTAVAPGDYVPYVDSLLVFQQNDLSVCHRVMINQDHVCENDPNERFFSRLRYIDGIMPIVIQPTLTEVVIHDTNEPECGAIQVGYEFTQYTTSEGAGVIELCAIISVPASGVAPREFVIEANTRDGSAVAGQDYIATVNELLVFNRGDSRVCHRASIINDSLCEVDPAENYFYELSLVNGTLPIRINRPEAEVIIDYGKNVPSASPKMFEATVGQRQVAFTWSPPQATRQNGVVTGYNLSCSPSPSSLPQSYCLLEPLTVTGFSPNTAYSCSVLATNSRGSGPPARVSFKTQQDCKCLLSTSLEWTSYYMHRFSGHNLEDIKETIGNLKDSFEELKKATRAATKSMRIEVLDLVDTVCSLPVTSVPADRQYLQEIVNQFHDSNSVDVVFSRLGFHWDYLHPDVYDQLIDKLQLYTYNPDLLQMVQTYRGHLDEFLEQTPLKEFCKVEKNFIVKNREHAKAVASVFFKNDWEEPVMLKQVEDLRRETALKCSLQQCAVIVFDIELGCYVPTLLVPVAAEPLIRSLDADFIRKHNVIAIIFQESVVYPQFPVGPTEQHRPQLPALEGLPVADTVAILERRFNYLRELTKQSLETHHISLQQVARYVTSLPADTENAHPEFLKGLESVLSQVVDHFELLGAMIYYWHYLCYDLLDHMTSTFNLDDVQAELQVYRIDVQHFQQQTTLVEFCGTETMKRVCPPEFSELVTELLWPDTIKLERVEEFRKEYLQIYHFHNYCMILGFVQLIEPSNAFRIHWFVPASATGTLKESNPEQLIERHNICRLEIAGECVFPLHTKSKILIQMDDDFEDNYDENVLLHKAYQSKVAENMLSQLVQEYSPKEEQTIRKALTELASRLNDGKVQKVTKITTGIEAKEALMAQSLPKIHYNNIITDKRNNDSIIPENMCTNELADKPQDVQPEDVLYADTDSTDSEEELPADEQVVAEGDEVPADEQVVAEGDEVPAHEQVVAEGDEVPAHDENEVSLDEELASYILLEELMVAVNNKDKDDESLGAGVPDAGFLAAGIAQQQLHATTTSSTEYSAEASLYAGVTTQPQTDVPDATDSLVGATSQLGTSRDSAVQENAVQKMQPEEEYDFVETPSDDYFCPILPTLLVRPHLTACCGKHLSEEAATRIKREKKFNICPLCNKVKLKTMLNRNFQRQVFEVTVFCRNRKRGCGWVGELSSYEDHIDNCPNQDNPLAEQKGLGNEVLSNDKDSILVNELIKVQQLAYELGSALKIPQHILDTIKTEEKRPLNRLIRVIDTFLSQENPKPTWRAIVEALQSPLVRRPKLAKKIETKYCTIVEDEEYDFCMPDKSFVRHAGTKIGHGIFGEVSEVAYKGKRYAAKQYRDAEDDVLIRTFGENSEICEIRHPNLLPYYGVCKLAVYNTTVVVMEKMERNLNTFLEGDVSQVQKFQILYDVIRGLNHLHTQRPAIIHGHLSVNNILLNAKGLAKISDFGNFHMVKSGLSSTAHASLNYMSPEALEGRDPNNKMDVFALGHLSVYVMNQSQPDPLKRPTYRDDQGKLIPRTEVERREEYLEQVKPQLDGGEMHPLYSIIIRCLKDEASERPSCEDILQTRIFPALIPDPFEKDPLDPDTVVRATQVVLGSGAYGDVVEVEHKGRIYAAKQHRSKGEEKSQEHDILTMIRHCNIVPYFGVCKMDPGNCTVMLMQRMEKNLAVFLEDETNSRMSLEEKRRIMRHIVCGLHHLHTDRPAIIHRDLTATNILLDTVGTAKIGDFGNAFIVDRGSLPARLTSIPGTIDYMPPEAQDCSEFDDKLDIFSLGHLLVYMMIQHRPQPLLGHTCREHDILRARTEVERRTEYLDEVKARLEGGEQHPIYWLIIHCLHDEANERPFCASILESSVFAQK